MWKMPNRVRGGNAHVSPPDKKPPPTNFSSLNWVLGTHGRRAGWKIPRVRMTLGTLIGPAFAIFQTYVTVRARVDYIGKIQTQNQNRYQPQS